MPPAATRPRSAPRERPGLTRDALLDVAVRIARSEDIGSLTLRRLAQEFAVTPMALYRHFHNKADLVDAVLDRWVQEAAVTEHDGDPADWQRWLRLTFGRMHRSLRDTPSVIPLLGSEYRFGPGAMATLEATLAVLQRAGFGGRETVETFVLLFDYTVGAAALEAIWRRDPDTGAEGDAQERRRQRQARFEVLSRTQFPHIVDLAADLATAALQHPFEAGLDRILASLAPARPRRRAPRKVSR